MPPDQKEKVEPSCSSIRPGNPPDKEQIDKRMTHGAESVKRLLTPAQASVRLGVTAQRIYQLVKHGRVVVVREDRRVFITCESVDGYRRKTPGPKPKTACKRGHVYTAETVRTTVNGGRWCRICERAATLDRYHRRTRRLAEVIR